MAIDVVGKAEGESSARKEADREGGLELPPEAVAQSHLQRGRESCKEKEGKNKEAWQEGYLYLWFAR